MTAISLWTTVTSWGSISQRGGTEMKSHCLKLKIYCLNVTSDNELSSEVGSGCGIGGETGVASAVTRSQAEEQDVAGEDVVLDLQYGI